LRVSSTSLADHAVDRAVETLERGAFMPLQSRLFKDDQKLQRCLVLDAAHVTPGSVGEHVRKLQTALALLEDVRIARSELTSSQYGPSTATAVLQYKQRRQIINRSYQNQADNIVGKMTIASLDRELIGMEQGSFPRDIECRRG
jgi:peptidoglycan hydrolase-like protein with peptidoglycan-binding domain